MEWWRYRGNWTGERVKTSFPRLQNVPIVRLASSDSFPLQGDESHASEEQAIKSLGGVVDIVIDVRGGEPGGEGTIEGLKALWGNVRAGGVYIIEGGEEWGGGGGAGKR
jgi:hypothetical protein